MVLRRYLFAGQLLSESRSDPPGRRGWKRQGNTRCLWSMTDVPNAITYVVEEQGEPTGMLQANLNELRAKWATFLRRSLTVAVRWVLGNTLWEELYQSRILGARQDLSVDDKIQRVCYHPCRGFASTYFLMFIRSPPQGQLSH